MARQGVAEQTALMRYNVEAIARSFVEEDALPTPSRCRAIVGLMGLPGSGKSHIGRVLAARLGGVVVASDALRRRLFIAPSYTRAETRTVFALAHAMTRLLLAKGHTVIFDATNLRERDRRPLYAVARETGVPLVLVRATAAEPLIRARLEARTRGESKSEASEADLRVYEAMGERVEEPTRATLIVDTSDDPEAELARVVRAVRGSCE